VSQRIDVIYNSIAENILKNISVSDWSEAVIDVVREADDVMRLSGGYSTFDVEFTSFKFRNFDRKIADEFHEIYGIMTENGDQHKWNRATFKLLPDGKFSIDFDWDQD